MTLTMAVRAGDQRHLARLLHANEPGLAADTAAGLDERRDANSHQLTPRPRRLALLDKLFVVGQLQRLVKRSAVIPRVVRRASRRLVWKFVGSDEVLAPQLDGIHTQCAGKVIDAVFNRQHRFRSTCPTIGARRWA